MKKIKDWRILTLSTGLALAFTVSIANAQQVVPDGQTATTVSVNGTTTNVTTATLSGANAFNSLTTLNVDAGNTVNLVVPAAAQNLINVVKGSQSNINGVLNGIQNGQIGGNIFLLNPYGVLVGSTGSINVSSLTVITPTQDFVNNFFSGGVPNTDSVNAVLNGTAPINSAASIVNNGVINAHSQVNLTSGTIANAARIALDLNNLNGNSLAQVVNLTADNINLESGSKIVACGGDVNINKLTNGDIEIVNTKSSTSTALQLTPNELSRINSQKLAINNTSTAQNLKITENLNRIGSLQLSAQNIEAKDINASKDVSVSAQITANLGNITSGQDINLFLNTGSIEAKNLNAGRDANLNVSFGSITTGNINAKQNIILSATRQSGILTGDLKAGYDIAAFQGIRTGNIVAGHDFTHRSISGGLTTGSIKAGNIISIDHTGRINPTTVNTGDLKANSDITILNPNSINTGNINTKGNLIANSDSITMKNIQTDENLDIQGNTIKTGNVNTCGELNITGRDSIQTENLFSRNNVNILAFDGTLPSGNITTKNIAAGGHILENALGPIRNGNLSAGRDVVLSVLSDGIYTGDINAGGNIIESGGFLNGAGGKISNGNLNAKGDVNLLVTLNTITTKNITAGGDIAETAVGDITNGNLLAGSNVILSSANNIKTGSISAKGNVTAGNITEDCLLAKAQSIKTQNITAGNNIDLAAHTVQTGKLKAGGVINIDKD